MAMNTLNVDLQCSNDIRKHLQISNTIRVKCLKYFSK